MKLLAIDTSTERASVALLVGDEMACEEQNSQKTHAKLLLPMIDQLMVHAGLELNQLDGIVFGCGPGSFTGLRIACSIAKGLAYAHDLALFPVSSLDAIAWTAREVQNNISLPLLAVLDARMHEIYWSYFAADILLSHPRVNAAQDIQLPLHQPILLAGVGIDEYWSDFPECLKANIIDKVTLYPDAAAMIRLAMYARIKAVSLTQAQPLYVRNQVTQGDSRG